MSQPLKGHIPPTQHAGAATLNNWTNVDTIADEEEESSEEETSSGEESVDLKTTTAIPIRKKFDDEEDSDDVCSFTTMEFQY